MKEQELNRLCNEHGLRNYDLFVEWFMKRFPNEAMESYVVEWIERFKSGNPAVYMDKISLKIYIDLQTDYYLKGWR